MAKFDKLKKKGGMLRLASAVPPPPDAAPGNVHQPEHAPALTKLPAAPETDDATQQERRWRRPDKKTNRTHQIGTRFTGDFVGLVHDVARRDKLRICEVIERGVRLYEQQQLKDSGASP